MHVMLLIQAPSHFLDLLYYDTFQNAPRAVILFPKIKHCSKANTQIIWDSETSFSLVCLARNA